MDTLTRAVLIICGIAGVTILCHAAVDAVTTKKADPELTPGKRVIFEKRNAVFLGVLRRESGMPVYSLRVYNQEAFEPKWSMIEALACEVTLPAER